MWSSPLLTSYQIWQPTLDCSPTIQHGLVLPWPGCSLPSASTPPSIWSTRREEDAKPVSLVRSSLWSSLTRQEFTCPSSPPLPTLWELENSTNSSSRLRSSTHDIIKKSRQSLMLQDASVRERLISRQDRSPLLRFNKHDRSFFLHFLAFFSPGGYNPEHWTMDLHAAGLSLHLYLLLVMGRG